MMERSPFTQLLPALVAMTMAFTQLGRGVSNFMDSDEAGVGRLVPEKTTADRTPNLPNYDDYEVFPYLKQSDLEQLTEGTVGTGRKYGQRYFPPDLPKFHKSDSPQNITAQLGSDISLDCRVTELKDKTVSWRRRNNDVELLTVALEKYSKEKRVTLEFIEPNNWRLSIKSVNLGDSGNYVCEVSSDPPMELSYHVHIVVPQVQILDEHGGVLVEKYYKKGSTIELKCIVKDLPQPLADVTWKHSHHLLNYDTSRGGISVKSEVTPDGTVISSLNVAGASGRDSGNYSCSVGDLSTSMVVVHVLNGENPGALQHGSRSSQQSRSNVLSGLAAVLIMSYVIGR